MQDTLKYYFDFVKSKLMALYSQRLSYPKLKEQETQTEIVQEHKEVQVNLKRKSSWIY